MEQLKLSGRQDKCHADEQVFSIWSFLNQVFLALSFFREDEIGIYYQNQMCYAEQQVPRVIHYVATRDVTQVQQVQ